MFLPGDFIKERGISSIHRVADVRFNKRHGELEYRWCYSDCWWRYVDGDVRTAKPELLDRLAIYLIWFGKNERTLRKRSREARTLWERLNYLRLRHKYKVKEIKRNLPTWF